MKLEKPNYLPGQELEDGTLYVGVITNELGESYHLSIEKESTEPMTWHEAVKNGQTPNLRELKLISANAYALGLTDITQWHWADTEYNLNNAYSERFSDGNQLYFGSKSHAFLVRGVRRCSIIKAVDSLKKELADLRVKLDSIERKLK